MKSPKYKTKPGTKARLQEHKQTQYQTKIKATLSQWQKLYESALLELIKEQLPRLGFVGTEVIIDITAAEIMGKQFWVIQNSEIPLSRAVRRAIRVYRDKKPEGFRFYSN
jgi:hypothetical protein